MSKQWLAPIALVLVAAGCGSPSDPPDLQCCPRGDTCDPALARCEIECPGSEMQCAADRRCAVDPGGEVSGCVAECDPMLACGDLLCCAPGSSCVDGACEGADLAIAIAGPESVTFSRIDVIDGACSLEEGWHLGTGRRARVHVAFEIENAGATDLVLGDPSRSSLYEASFCSGDWVISGLVAATLRDAGGATVAEGELDVRCIAGGGSYSCEAQGLAAGTAIPGATANDFVDVTGVGEGTYTLELELDPRGALGDPNDANDRATVSFDYPDCDGSMCGETCCPDGVACEDGVCMLPDLRINQESIERTVVFNYRTFPEGACEIVEGCVGGPGRRRLLQFEGRIENWGPGNLDGGRPEGNPNFEYSACHMHYHFLDFTDYRLERDDGTVIAQGHKQSFCLIDMVEVGDLPPEPPGTHPEPGERNCSQLTAGWGDVYGVGTPCQWVDVTDVPEGDYVLQVAVNPEGRIDEADASNNVVRMPIHVPEDVPCVPVDEICGDGLDQNCNDIVDDGCTCWPAGEETCGNGVDEDCDGVADDGCDPLAGTDRCDTAPVITTIPGGRATARAMLSAAGTRAGACGGLGGEAFYRFTLAESELVYLSTFGSEMDTVLSILPGDCASTTEIACTDDSCHETQSHWAGVLAAGSYVVHVRGRATDATGVVRLDVRRTGVADATVITGPGIYAGTTTGAPAIATSCTAAAPTDVFYALRCNEFEHASTTLYSTCGGAEFASSLEVAQEGMFGPQSVCSEGDFMDFCSGDPDGATLQPYTTGRHGMDVVRVTGRTPTDHGEYRLFVSY